PPDPRCFVDQPAGEQYHPVLQVDRQHSERALGLVVARCDLCPGGIHGRPPPAGAAIAYRGLDRLCLRGIGHRAVVLDGWPDNSAAHSFVLSMYSELWRRPFGPVLVFAPLSPPGATRTGGRSMR